MSTPTGGLLANVPRWRSPPTPPSASGAGRSVIPGWRQRSSTGSPSRHSSSRPVPTPTGCAPRPSRAEGGRQRPRVDPPFPTPTPHCYNGAQSGATRPGVGPPQAITAGPMQAVILTHRLHKFGSSESAGSQYPNPPNARDCCVLMNGTSRAGRGRNSGMGPRRGRGWAFGGRTSVAPTLVPKEHQDAGAA
jgi:hypothetical protein